MLWFGFLILYMPTQGKVKLNLLDNNNYKARLQQLHTEIKLINEFLINLQLHITKYSGLNKETILDLDIIKVLSKIAYIPQ